MTLQEYEQRLSQLAGKVTEAAYKAAVVPAGIKLLATIRNRISVDGKNSQEADIGSYSTKPMYAAKRQFVKKGAFRGEGKVRKNTKTMYLPSGYQQLRGIQGRPTDRMNYDYSGSTLSEYKYQIIKEGLLIGMVSEKSSIIRKALEKKRGAAFSGSQRELEEYNKDVAKDAEGITLKILANVQ